MTGRGRQANRRVVLSGNPRRESNKASRPALAPANQQRFWADLNAQSTRQIALAFIDLDNFKSVNDIHGHLAGTACLEKVDEAIKQSVARKGNVHRYGGDEFAVILKNVDLRKAAAMGDHIRRAIKLAKPGGDIEITASIGVVTSDQPGLTDSDKLFRAANRAMYRSKDRGGNKVTIHNSDNETAALLWLELMAAVTDKDWLRQLRKQSITTIVAVNDGLVPAAILARNLGIVEVQYVVVDEKANAYDSGIPPLTLDLSARKVLLLDDQIYTGRSMTAAHRMLLQMEGASADRIVRTALFRFDTPIVERMLDLEAPRITKGRIRMMPWSFTPEHQKRYRDRRRTKR